MCGIFYGGFSRQAQIARSLLRQTEIPLIDVKEFGEDYGPPLLQIGGKTYVGLLEIQVFCRSNSLQLTKLQENPA
jgi:hypothetical protein